MRFSLMTEPQLGGTYDQLLDLARWARDRGFHSFARSDHYYFDRDPAPEATDAFATLAGLARETSDIRLCVLVSPVTFRHPAVIAKNAATIDQMSGGRLDLGVGTGWMELEHDVYGLPFPPRAERFDRLTEALNYLRAAFEGGSYSGTYYRIEADARPKPTDVRLVVGGSGPTKTPTLAGTHADEYNHFASTPSDLEPKIRLVREVAEREGRDPDAITMSIMGPVFTGADDADYRSRIADAASSRNVTVGELETRLGDRGIPFGPPDRVAETITALEQVGAELWYLQWIDLEDRDGLDATWEGLRGLA
jgi:alkanesulfonate monooxygenase SsuD/methylene tetrahydromethanopterin reductase-like flavin-dependent oxidoreductase (luciferase family)